MNKKILAFIMFVCLLYGSSTYAFSWKKVGGWFHVSFGNELHVAKNINISQISQISKNPVNFYRTISKKVEKVAIKSNFIKRYKLPIKPVLPNPINPENPTSSNEPEVVNRNNFDSPVIKNKYKKEIQNAIDNLDSTTVNKVDSRVVKKFKDKENLINFDLGKDFDPNKPVTFDDIREAAYKNIVLHEKNLDCDNADDAIAKLCVSLEKLRADLANDNKKLSINDLYKLQLYQVLISKAIYYEGFLRDYKRGAIVLGIDKKENLLKSIDIVRSYSEYNTGDNDILPITAKEVVIGLYDKLPSLIGGYPSIILGINNGSVVGIKIYPLDKNLDIPHATSYKVMIIKGYKKGCSNYTDSFWYGDTEIGLSHNGKNLEPKYTKGIKINRYKKCYEVFDKTGNQNIYKSQFVVSNTGNVVHASVKKDCKLVKKQVGTKKEPYTVKVSYTDKEPYTIQIPYTEKESYTIRIPQYTYRTKYTRRCSNSTLKKYTNFVCSSSDRRKSSIIGIYKTLFHRCPEPAGLNRWRNERIKYGRSYSKLYTNIQIAGRNDLRRMGIYRLSDTSRVGPRTCGSGREYVPYTNYCTKTGYSCSSVPERYRAFSGYRTETRYRTVTKHRTETRYRTVTKYRTETKYKTVPVYKMVKECENASN